jgi:hypothetical protein
MNPQAGVPSGPPTPLAGLFPKRLHGTLLPTSVFLMGVIAVAVQYHSGEAIPRTRLRRRFSSSLVCLLVGLVVFLAIYSLFVLRVPYVAEGVVETEPVLISWSRVPTCECPATASDLECLRRVSMRAEAIESCWGGRRLALLSFTFSLAYLSLTGGFAALVGLLVLQEGQPTRKRRPRGPPA